MKTIFKKILATYLKFITKIILFIHKPKIIAVAGSINKTFTKEEIKSILESQGLNARSNPKNFNTEIGLPLSILYLPSGYNSYKNWLPIILKAPLAVFHKNFPEYLVLELGTSDPGDMRYLLSIARPQIAIITDITQRYLESFSDMDELVEEYKYLAQIIPNDGLLILNGDNERIKTVGVAAKCKTIFFGIDNPCQWQGINITKSLDGQRVTIVNEGKKNEHFIKRFGRHHVYALLVGQIIKKYVSDIKKQS